MKFSPKVVVTGITQDVFQAMRLCEAICGNYRVELLVSYMDGPNGKFAISTTNMRGNMWHIMEDMVQFLENNFVVIDKFSKVDKTPQILIQKDNK